METEEVELYWNDLKPEVQAKLIEQFPSIAENNWDVFPMATIHVSLDPDNS